MAETQCSQSIITFHIRGTCKQVSSQTYFFFVFFHCAFGLWQWLKSPVKTEAMPCPKMQKCPGSPITEMLIA